MSLLDLNSKEYPLLTGSGVMLGAVGRHYNDVDAICFLMMRKIKRIVLRDVNYPIGEHETKTKREVSVLT